MKSLFVPVLCVILLVGRVASAQENPVNKDSLDYENVVVSPDLTPKATDQHTGYLVTENNLNRFQAYAGVSVLNNLRGRLPSYTISPEITEINSHNIRTALSGYSGNSMLVIDGMTFYSDVLNYYNLNSFEFEKISAVSSGGATAAYGALGSNGGIFLHSKSGEGKSNALIEFNSHSSIYLPDGIDRYYHEYPTKSRSVFTNALAYGKDWGPVDARVSYSHSTSPNYGGHSDGYQHVNSVKLNTGWNAGKKFTARFVGDFRGKKNLMEIPAEDPTLSVSNDRTGGSIKYLQGNLTMQYSLLPKLKISSMNVLSDADSDIDKRLFSNPFETSQKKRLHNLILTYSPEVLKKIAMKVYGGGQYEEFDYRRTNGSSESLHSSKTKAVLAGFDANISDIVIVDAAFRRESIDNPARTKILTASSGSAGVALIVNNALGIAREKFGMKVRSNIGRSGYSYWHDYPVFEAKYPLQPSAAPRIHIEAGADLSFLKNTVTLSLNYFEVVDQEVWSMVLEPELTFIYSYGEFHNSGTEAVLKILPVNTTDIRFQSTVMIYKRNESFKPSKMRPDAYDGTYFSGTLPDIEASLLNELNWKNIFVSLLVEAKQGEDYSLVTYYGNSVNVEGSFAKLRALTIGYSLSPDVLEKVRLDGATVSLTGMNLWQSHAPEKHPDVYMTTVAGLNKTISLSLSLQF
jgi:hypothetical protein